MTLLPTRYDPWVVPAESVGSHRMPLHEV